MYFISDIQALDAKKIHRAVKYFAAPAMRLIYIAPTPLEPSMLKIVLPNGMMSVSVPLTEDEAMNWRPYLANTTPSEGLIAGDEGICVSLSLLMTSRGAASPSLNLELNDTLAASLHLDIDRYSELCSSFAHQDPTPLIYTLYHITHNDDIWTLRCFDKSNAPLRLLTGPRTHCEAPTHWNVKPIPFPEYFSDQALHQNPYSTWGCSGETEDCHPHAQAV